MTNETQTMNDRKLFRAAILTPYLLDSAEGLKAEGFSDYDIQNQIRWYGLDLNNLRGVKHMKAGNIDVLLETDEDHTLDDSANADLIIIGSAESAESKVRKMVGRNPRAIIARYSVFYGRPSEYTGKRPEDAGYALDLNKKVSVARALLTHEATLSALLNRDESQVREAIAQLNLILENPILITPYLTKALEARK